MRRIYEATAPTGAVPGADGDVGVLQPPPGDRATVPGATTNESSDFQYPVPVQDSGDSTDVSKLVIAVIGVAAGMLCFSINFRNEVNPELLLHLHDSDAQEGMHGTQQCAVTVSQQSS